QFRGRESDTAGDGFLAAFDGPAQAVRWQCAIVSAARRLGLDVREGLHPGECEVLEAKLRGIAAFMVALGASHALRAAAVVSRTVKDLMAGAGIAFEDRGVRVLKGVAGEWQLHAVDPS